jgi:hypothetical protein
LKGRKLRLYEENKGITDIAGKGVDGNATGSAAYSSFGQPVGIHSFETLPSSLTPLLDTVI